jgi:UDP-2-acetamido-3-amino-2,3-dideoxy-glucuronate N-acetyltransferase
MESRTIGRSLALIGAGYWGKNLARNFAALEVLHTICDVNEALLDTYQALYPGVVLTSSYTAVMENPEIRAVVIAAPVFQHYALAKEAILAGKDVFVEKPLCLDCSEAEELIQLAERQGVILMVGHLLQYHPCVRKLQQMVAQGELGKLQYIVSNRLNLGSIRMEENALWNFAPHDVSVILSLCGHTLPDQVRCVGAAYMSPGVADVSMTTLRFAGDLRAHIYVSWLNPFKEQKLVVVGSSGLAVFDDTKPWKEKLQLYRNHVKWKDGTIPHINNSVPEFVEVNQAEPLREECLHFLECCEERLSPLTNGQEGLRVLRVLQAAQESLDQDGEARDPRAHLAVASKPHFFAHETAIIDPLAQIGHDAKIWHFSKVMANAHIGARCNIGQNVVISPGVRLGANVKVQNNVSLYSGFVCEDDVFLGPSSVYTNVINPRSAIGRKNEYQETLVRRGATIGANATILCGIELGQHCFIGAGAVVTRSVKPFALIVGNPGRHVGWMSRHGTRLDLPVRLPEGEEHEATCPDTGELYRLQGEDLILVGSAVDVGQPLSAL